jgi:hypothetical protein
MEKKNYQIRVGNMKCIAWSNTDKNQNTYFSYQVSRSIKNDDGTYKDEKISLFANELCVLKEIVDRMIASIALRPSSFVSKDNSMPSPEDVTVGDDMPY